MLRTMPPSSRSSPKCHGSIDENASMDNAYVSPRRSHEPSWTSTKRTPGMISGLTRLAAR